MDSAEESVGPPPAGKGTEVALRGLPPCDSKLLGGGGSLCSCCVCVCVHSGADYPTFLECLGGVLEGGRHPGSPTVYWQISTLKWAILKKPGGT